MATTCAQCGVPMQLWAGKLECFGLDCCTTGAAVVALAQSIRSFARRARAEELRKDVDDAHYEMTEIAAYLMSDTMPPHERAKMRTEYREHRRQFDAALTELVALAKEGA
jgi:hypothetical protein